MSAIRVILITVAGPGGHVDVGVRSDATAAELAVSLAPVLGISPPWPIAEHRAPPRPGEPRGRRTLLEPGTVLADAGVTDGDLVLFRQQQAAVPSPPPAGSLQPATRPDHPPAAIDRYPSPPPAEARADLGPSGPIPASPIPAGGPDRARPGSSGSPAAPPWPPAEGNPYGAAPYLGIVNGSSQNGHGRAANGRSDGAAASDGGLTDYGAAEYRILPDGTPGYRAPGNGVSYPDPAPGCPGSSYLDTPPGGEGSYPGGAPYDSSQPYRDSPGCYPPHGYGESSPDYPEPGYGTNPGQPGPTRPRGGYAANSAGFAAETGGDPGELPDYANPRSTSAPDARPAPDAGPATGAGPGSDTAAADRTAPVQPGPEQGAEQE